MKRFLTIIMSVMLLFSILVMPNYAEGNNEQNKISEELQMHIDQDEEEIPVYIWFEDIDLETINAEAEKAVGYTQEDIQAAEDNIPLFNSDLNESDPDFDELFLEYAEQTRTERVAVLEMQNRLIEVQRELTSEAYEKYNIENLSRININTDNVLHLSKFSPVIIAILTTSDIARLQKIPSVIEIGYKNMATPTALLNNALPTVEAKYVRDTLGYDGYNVKIGMYDVGRVKTVSELSSTTITKLDSGIPENSHPTSVAMIIAGSNGTAPNAHLYTSSNGSTYEQGIEALINQGVSAINVSVDFGRADGDYYTDFEKWMDHIATIHNITMVIAAGNHGTNSVVVNPGLAYNVITVGGTNTNGSLTTSDDFLCSYSSAANGGTNGCAKPDVLAPAEYQNMYNDNWQHTNSGGTSLAAPLVTGIIAQMIECRPTIAVKPEVIKAVLTSSTMRKLPSTSYGTPTEAWADTITAQQGAGEVNARKAILILSLGHYASGTMSSTTVTKTFSVTSSDLYIRYSVAWLRNNTVGNCSNPNTTVGTAANLKLRLFDSNNTVLFTSNIPTSSVELAHISIDGIYGTYKAKIYRVDSGSNSFRYAVAWR